MPADPVKSPAAFRSQLLARLRNEALTRGISPARLQQQVAFERLLAHLVGTGEWVLKGGFALQLRYSLLSRPTRDVDLSTALAVNQALDRLRERIGSAPRTDLFQFELGEVAQEMQGAPGGSLRVRVSARIGGVDFVLFHIDLSSGDALVDAPDQLRGSDLLGFAGIEPVEFPVYPIVQHIAEKLHAYTLPREQENTRIKDLVDMVFIASADQIDADSLITSVRATFDTRNTHSIPIELPTPPDSWTRPFATLSSEVPNAPTTDLVEGHQRAARFWNPPLAGTVNGDKWSPGAGRWIRPV